METRPENGSLSSLTSSLAANIYDRLFPKHLQLVPGISDIYELELAFYECVFR